VSNIVKEFSDMTPILLAVVSDAPESNSIEVIKHLQDKNANLSAVDFNKNTILHLAVKHNKLEIIKYFQEILTPYLFEANKEGQTPFGIAKENNFSEIKNFLNSIAENPENNRNIEEELNELIEATNQQKNKKKKKGNKKNAKDEVRLLNSAGFQETFKFKQPSAAAQKTPINANDQIKENKKKEEIEETVDTNLNRESANKEGLQGKNSQINQEVTLKGKSRGDIVYENADAFRTADRNNNNNLNVNGKGGYKHIDEYTKGNYNDEYTGYDHNYEYAEYEYTDKYGNSNYNSGYKSGFNGKYGYQNYERGNNSRYYGNDRDSKYNNHDYGKHAKSFEKVEVIEKIVNYEEKVVSVVAANVNKNEKEEKNVAAENINNENPNGNANDENLINLETNKEENNFEKNVNENKDIKEIKNDAINYAANNNNNNTDKEKELATKEKKIIGLDAKTLKKLEKKEKKAKGAISNRANEKRKLSKDEPPENEKDGYNANTEKTKKKDSNGDNGYKVQIPEKISCRKTQELETQKPNVNLNSEKSEENNNLVNKEVECKTEKTKEENAIDHAEENNEEVCNKNEEKVENLVEGLSLIANETEQEDRKGKLRENRMENIYVNEDLLYSKEIIKKYYVGS
jgi:hypothetical protein